MKKNFTNEQIIYTLRQAESGTSVAEVCRKTGITEQTFYRWKRKFAGIGVAELARLRQPRRREQEAQVFGRRPDSR
jgi:putative transposase